MIIERIEREKEDQEVGHQTSFAFSEVKTFLKSKF